MAELLDFMVVRSDRSEAVAKYTVLYRPADYFCKRLNFEFDNSEEAEAVAFYFQYWMNAGGRVRYTGAPDIPGVLMSMDGSDMTDCPMDLSKQLYCLHRTRHDGYPNPPCHSHHHMQIGRASCRERV